MNEQQHKNVKHLKTQRTTERKTKNKQTLTNLRQMKQHVKTNEKT